MTDTNSDTGNLIDDTWPIGCRFTISLIIEEKGAAGHFLRAMNENESFHGCKVVSVAFADQSQRNEDFKNDLVRLMEKYR